MWSSTKNSCLYFLRSNMSCEVHIHLLCNPLRKVLENLRMQISSIWRRTKQFLEVRNGNICNFLVSSSRSTIFVFYGNKFVAISSCLCHCMEILGVSISLMSPFISALVLPKNILFNISLVKVLFQLLSLCRR